MGILFVAMCVYPVLGFRKLSSMIALLEGFLIVVPLAWLLARNLGGISSGRNLHIVFYVCHHRKAAKKAATAAWDISAGESTKAEGAGCNDDTGSFPGNGAVRRGNPFLP